MNSRAVDRIPEDRIPGILARAAELDRDRRESITVDAIRTAALDAGISSSAVDAALEEYAAREGELLDAGPPHEERISWFGRARRFAGRIGSALKTPVKLGAAFMVLGLTGAALEPMFVVGWLAWLAAAGLLIRKHRPARRVAPYLLTFAFVTIGLGAGFGMAELDEEVIATMFALAVPILAVGSLVIKVRMPRRFRRAHRRELEAHAG